MIEDKAFDEWAKQNAHLQEKGKEVEAYEALKSFTNNELRKKFLHEMKEEIVDLRAEHNIARHGNDPYSAYDRVEGMLWRKEQNLQTDPNIIN